MTKCFASKIRKWLIKQAVNDEVILNWVLFSILIIVVGLLISSIFWALSFYSIFLDAGFLFGIDIVWVGVALCPIGLLCICLLRFLLSRHGFP